MHDGDTKTKIKDFFSYLLYSIIYTYNLTKSSTQFKMIERLRIENLQIIFCKTIKSKVKSSNVKYLDILNDMTAQDFQAV